MPPLVVEAGLQHSSMERRGPLDPFPLVVRSEHHVNGVAASGRSNPRHTFNTSYPDCNSRQNSRFARNWIARNALEPPPIPKLLLSTFIVVLTTVVKVG